MDFKRLKLHNHNSWQGRWIERFSALLSYPEQLSLETTGKMSNAQEGGNLMQNNTSNGIPAKSVLELLLSTSSEAAVISYCTEKLAPLRLYDEQQSANYVETLRTYLACNNELVHSSRMLFIHRNTMVNRIRKINELLNVNMNDPETTNEFMNIFQVLDHYAQKAYKQEV